MRSILFISLFTLLYLNLSAQGKHDYHWIFSRSPGGGEIDFNFTPPKMKLSDRVFEVTTGTGISDSSGHLLFWTNGCYIFNANDQILPNGKINPGQIHDSYCQDELGYPGFYPMSYGHLAVPDPRAPNRYMLFQLQRSDSIGFVIGLLSTTLKHDPTTGQITVLEPNTPVFNLDTGEFLSEQLVAVKHANGRDWWILLAAFNSNNYFKFLLGPSGISGPNKNLK